MWAVQVLVLPSIPYAASVAPEQIFMTVFVDRSSNVALQDKIEYIANDSPCNGLYDLQKRSYVSGDMKQILNHWLVVSTFYRRQY